MRPVDNWQIKRAFSLPRRLFGLNFLSLPKSIFKQINIIHMKSALITLFAVATLSISATAQEKKEMRPPHMQKHQHGMMMARQLNFSEAQKKQAKAYNEDFRKKMQDLNKNESITVKEFRDRKAALRKEQRSKMQGLLTVEQKNKMAQLKAEQKAKREEHFAKHLNKMKTELGLTDQQVAQMKTQRESIRSKYMAIKENEALSREEKRDKLMALRTEMKEQHKKIFTPEQQQKMEEMRKKHFEKPPAK
jgi:protein CpxP